MPGGDDGSITDEVAKRLEKITKQVKSKEQKAKAFKAFGDALMKQVKEKRVADAIKKIDGIIDDIKLARSKIEKYTKDAKKSKDAKAKLRTWNDVLRNLFDDFAVAQTELVKALNDLKASSGGLSSGGGGGSGKNDPAQKLQQAVKDLSSVFSSVLKEANEAAKQLSANKSSAA